jgi:hypothetical protein
MKNIPYSKIDSNITYFTNGYILSDSGYKDTEQYWELSFEKLIEKPSEDTLIYELIWENTN